MGGTNSTPSKGDEPWNAPRDHSFNNLNTNTENSVISSVVAQALSLEDDISRLTNAFVKDLLRMRPDYQKDAFRNIAEFVEKILTHIYYWSVVTQGVPKRIAAVSYSEDFFPYEEGSSSEDIAPCKEIIPPEDLFIALVKFVEVGRFHVSSRTRSHVESVNEFFKNLFVERPFGLKASPSGAMFEFSKHLLGAIPEFEEDPVKAMTNFLQNLLDRTPSIRNNSIKVLAQLFVEEFLRDIPARSAAEFVTYLSTALPVFKEHPIKTSRVIIAMFLRSIPGFTKDPIGSITGVVAVAENSEKTIVHYSASLLIQAVKSKVFSEYQKATSRDTASMATSFSNAIPGLAESHSEATASFVTWLLRAIPGFSENPSEALTHFVKDLSAVPGFKENPAKVSAGLFAQFLSKIPGFEQDPSGAMARFITSASIYGSVHLSELEHEPREEQLSSEESSSKPADDSVAGNVIHDGIATAAFESPTSVAELADPSYVHEIVPTKLFPEDSLNTVSDSDKDPATSKLQNHGAEAQCLALEESIFGTAITAFIENSADDVNTAEAKNNDSIKIEPKISAQEQGNSGFPAQADSAKVTIEKINDDLPKQQKPRSFLGLLKFHLITTPWNTVKGACIYLGSFISAINLMKIMMILAGIIMSVTCLIKWAGSFVTKERSQYKSESASTMQQPARHQKLQPKNPLQSRERKNPLVVMSQRSRATGVNEPLMHRLLAMFG